MTNCLFCGRQIGCGDYNSHASDCPPYQAVAAETKGQRFVQSSDRWSDQIRAVYTSEVMERELDKLFPVDEYLARKHS